MNIYADSLNVGVQGAPSFFETITPTAPFDQSSFQNFEEFLFQSSERFPTLQSLKDYIESPQIEDDSKLAAKEHRWGKLLNTGKRMLGDDKHLFKMCDVIRDEGLQCEQHELTTKDGYIIEMFRVRMHGTPQEAKPIFLQHGLFSDATTWATHTDKSLAQTLARQGYDVWAGNNRGNIYGRRHVKLDAWNDSDKFFEYSFYENGEYDTANQVEFALKTSGHSKLSYLAHSQGTTQMFSQLADGTFFHDKVDLVIACAPIVYLDHQKEEYLKKLSEEWRNLYLASKLIQVYEANDSIMVGYKKFCTLYSDFCNLIYDYTHTQSIYSDPEADRMQQKMDNMMSASIKQLLHLGQIISKKKFIQFDYHWPTSNFAHYGSLSPPEIKLSNIPKNIPIALLVGKQDTLANKVDVDRLALELGNQVVMHKEYDEFDHFSFSVGKDMSWTQDVLDLIKQVEQPTKQ